MNTPTCTRSTSRIDPRIVPSWANHFLVITDHADRCSIHDPLQNFKTLPERQKTILLHILIEVIPHPSYRQDLVTSDYHLALDRHMTGKQWSDEDALKINLSSFVDARPLEFFRKNINSLHKRCHHSIETDVDCIRKLFTKHFEKKIRKGTCDKNSGNFLSNRVSVLMKTFR